MAKKTSRVLPVIVIAQFLCTSLWFAGNAVIPDLAREFNLSKTALGHILSAVQFGFIVGTLSYALFSLADRFSPAKIFFFSALAAAGFNLAMAFNEQNISSLLALRFFTGFFLAGIYPVGMKIAADYYDKGLGKALGFLVGALVLGTAFPHLLKSLSTTLPWKTVLYFTSGLSVTGGLLILSFVPNGPYRKIGQRLNISAVFSVFRNKTFRSASFGYFGHMWELYTFWAFVPVILAYYQKVHPQLNINIPLLSFLVIALGGLACVAGGYISQKTGTRKTAFLALFCSGCCCLLSAFAFHWPVEVFIPFLIFWGLVVIADSPLFSTLVAQNAPAATKGTALTIVTCIGFSITILSIELINTLSGYINEQFLYLFLAPGPVIGLVYMLKTKDNSLKYSKLAALYTYLLKPAKRRQALKEINFYRSFLPPASLIFDIGANDGHKTVAFAAIATKVIACEPDPHNLSILNTSFRNKKNIIIEPFAVTDHAGTTNLYIHEPGSALNTVNPGFKKILETENNGRWATPVKFSGEVIEVNTTTLDALITKHGLPQMIKIDVEGNEKNVLRGLTHAVNYISFEVLLPEFSADAIACMDMLIQLNNNTRFNYAIEEELVLPDFITYEDFKKLLLNISINHFEVIASGV